MQLQLSNGRSEEIAAFQALFESSPTYFERINGGPAGSGEAMALFTELPAGSSRENKRVFAITRGGQIVGCIDLVDDYPESGTAMLGLLLVGEPWHGEGIGSRACGILEELLSARGVARIRIGVVRTNDDVIGFWHRMGFRETGEVKPYAHGPVSSEVIVLQKALAGGMGIGGEETGRL